MSSFPYSHILGAVVVSVLPLSLRKLNELWLCMPSNGSIEVICCDGICGFYSQLCDGIPCWGGVNEK